MHHRNKVPTMALTRVALASGRSVDLSELRMSSTGGGPLEGYPCKNLNDRRIACSARPSRPSPAPRCI